MSTSAQPQRLAVSISRNTFYGVVASVVQIGTKFVTVPAVIAHLGLGGFGIWNILLTIMAYMRFGSVGIRSAFQKYVAEATGNGDYEGASSLLSTGTAGITLLSLVALIPVALLAGRIASASGIPGQFIEASSVSIAIMALFLMISNFASAYEAMVMGGHRIDLTRKLGTVLSVVEALLILSLLRLGYGLIGMTSVLAFSEVVYACFVYRQSKKVVPEIRIEVSKIKSALAGELFRYAGSYQLVSILQLTYGALAPIAILKAYGAESSGVYALATRLASPVSVGFYAFLVPVLSGMSMVYASGSSEKVSALLAKSVKATIVLTLLPLALVCAFGNDLILAWTGEQQQVFGAALLLVSLATIANCFALLGLVLYRASGKTVMDNLREVLRIAILLPIVFNARKLGFIGVLGGLAVAESCGAIFMLFVLKRNFPVFRLRLSIGDFSRLALATAILVTSGLVLNRALPFGALSPRLGAAARLGSLGAMLLLLVYPVFLVTGAVTKAEVSAVVNTFWKKAKANG